MVTLRWLVDSCAAGKLLPIDAHLFSDKQDGGQTIHNSSSCHPDFDVQVWVSVLHVCEWVGVCACVCVIYSVGHDM